MHRVFRASLLLLSVCLASQVRAQQPVFQIDLREQPLMVPAARFYVVRVLDLRPNHSTIGWVQRGMNNIRVPATLRGGVAPHVAQWLSRQRPPRPGAQPIVLRIHDLRISEATGPVSEKSVATVDLDFLVQQPDSQYYQLLRHPDEEIHRGLEVTAFHADNLRACFQRALTELQTFDWEARLRVAPPIASARLTYRNGRPPEVYAFPVLTAAAPARGLYRSFLAFRRNAPDTNGSFVIEKTPRTETEWQGTDEVELLAGTGSARVALPGNGVWGFSDGHQAYIRFHRHYYPLQRAGNDFTFEGRAGGDPGAMGTAGFIAGAAGVLVAAAATSGHREEYTLDMASGRVSDFDYLEAILQRDTATIIVYRRRSRDADKMPVSIRVDNRELAAPAPAEYVLLPWTNKTREVTLTLPGAQPTIVSFIPDFTAVTYLELRPASTAGQWLLEPVSAKEGSTQVKKMQRTDAW